MTEQIRIEYFSDVLCVWAYAAQIRLDELQRTFGSRIVLQHHVISVFGNTRQRINGQWADRGGFEGFADHVQEVVHEFPHLSVSDNVWRKNIPCTSGTSHLFLKAVQQLQHESVLDSSIDPDHGRSIADEFLWQMRLTFFTQAADISHMETLYGIAESLHLPCDEIQRVIANGTALAALMADLELREKYRLEGSPTYILDGGRQKLYGNVGYRIIEANVLELLSTNNKQASWC